GDPRRPASSPDHQPGTMRKLIATTLLVLAATALWAASASAADAPPQAPHVPGELLVKFDGGAEQVLDLPQGVGLAAAEQALAANPAVSYAVPNYIAHASAIP